MGILDGRVVAITGAGRGIGAGIARLCAAEGASVVVNDSGAELDGTGGSTSPAESVAAGIRGGGGQAVALGDDIATTAGGENLLSAAVDSFGKLDVLINCAGILRDRMIFNMSPEEWDAVIRVHLKGHFCTIRPAAAYWRSIGDASAQHRLINFTSNSGLYGAPGQPNYAAAKLGVVGLTYSCANALARYGVTANAIAPIASTRMTDSAPTGHRRFNVEGDEFDPANVAPMVAYLASEASGWCTGQVIGSGGYAVSLFTQPTVARQIVSAGPWTLDRLIPLVERSFKPATEGKQR
jgi:NAD(P)-dependent dehydrogenase (short-subunit alcohol dehydrogenase family)